MKLQFLHMPGCHTCIAVEKMLNEEIKPQFPDLEIEKINMTTEQGQELVQKYSIMASPGIVIEGELFSTGKPDKKKLVEKLESLKK